MPETVEVKKMTVAKFLVTSGCGTSSEVIKYSQTDKPGFDTLKKWAREQMALMGIEVEEVVK
jgi:hypothetical protein